MSTEPTIDLPAIANALLGRQVSPEELAEARAERYRAKHRGRRGDCGEWTYTCEGQIKLRDKPDLFLHVEITYSVSRDWKGEGPRAAMVEGLDVDAVTFAGMGPTGACDAFPRLNRDEAAAVGLMAEAIYAALRETIIDFCESEPVLSWAREQALKDFQKRMRE